MTSIIIDPVTEDITVYVNEGVANGVTLDGVQTLTNKTLTSPVVQTGIFDANGNELLKVEPTASAVNEITLTNAATTGAPSLSATGTDANIDLNLISKGTGVVEANGIPLVTTTGAQTLTDKTFVDAALGTPLSATLTNATGLPNAGVTMATARLLGRTTAGTGSAEAITVGSGLTLSAGTLSASDGSTITISNKTAAYTVVAGDNGTMINCTSGTFTVSLTAAATLGVGFNVIIQNNGTGTIIIDPNGTETLDGINTPLLSLKQGAGYRLVCTGTNWHIVSIKASGGSGGALAVQLGSGAVSGGSYSVAIGTNASTNTQNQTAIGMNSSTQPSQAVTGQGAMALGGSYASGTDSFAAAIGNNTSTYGAQGANSVAIGQLAKATGAQAIAIGNNGAQSTALESMAFGGSNATANYAMSFGSNAVANAVKAVAMGAGAIASQIGKYAFGGATSGSGAEQYGVLVVRASTTGSVVVMTSDGGAASTTNQLIAASNQVMAFTGTLIGKQTGSANIAAYEIKGTLVNNAGTVTMPTGTLTLIGTDTIGLTTAPTLLADNTNKGLTVTSGAKTATNIRWCAAIRTTELVYA